MYENSDKDAFPSPLTFTLTIYDTEEQEEVQNFCIQLYN